jgi:hypothetical protein
MSSVKFKEHLLVKGGQDNTIEDAFRICGEYAGIHTFNFDSEFSEDGDDLSQWDTDSEEGTWSSTGSVISGTGGGSGYYFMVSQDEMPKAYLVRMSVTGTEGAVGVLATDEDTMIFYWWSATQVGITQRSSDSDTNLIVLPKTSVDGWLEVSVQPGTDDDCFISSWLNEQFQANAHIDTYPTGRLLALGCHDANTTTFDNIEIQELTEVIEFITIDTGTFPLNALQRTIGRRHINYFVRFDGSLRAWRPKAATVSRTIDTDMEDAYMYEHRIDRKALVSHWRQVGAWDTADSFDDDLMANIGHKFHKDDNPDLMTEDDCQNEADRSIIRAQEYAEVLSAAFIYCPFMEPEDVISFNGTSWIVSDYDGSLNAGELTANAHMRKYMYG